MNATEVAVLAPVKRLELAKLRLVGTLTPEQRADLVLAMLEDVLAAAKSVARSVFVLSPDQRVLILADRLGARPLAEEPETGSLNEAIERAIAATCQDAGAALVLLPDTPLAVPEELQTLLGYREARHSPVQPGRVGLAPDRREDGTNALLLAPPSIVSPQFGERSLAAHLRSAEARGVTPNIVRLPGLALDLDTRADLELFLARPSPTRTFALLSGILSPAAL